MRINQQRAAKPSAAFTLVETCVAMLILAIFVVSAYASVSAWFSTMSISREDLRATQILVEKTETLRLYKWSDVKDVTTVPIKEPYNYKDPESGFVYTGNITVGKADLGESYDDTLRLVTVSLYWTNNGVPRSRQLQTLVSQYGMQNTFINKK